MQREDTKTSPRLVTRGVNGRNEAVFVDFLTVTVSDGAVRRQLFEEGWRAFLGGEWRLDECKAGVFGFEEASSIVQAGPGGRDVSLGLIAYGGRSQAGRFLISLSGFGCSKVIDWRALHDWLAGREARITRVDLSVDLFDGVPSVHDAVTMYRAGEFRSGRGNPSSSQVGDWLADPGMGTGRTFYIGKPGAARRLCVYEKGLKNRPDSGDPWVRWELRLGGDMDIPLAVLLDPTRFYAGGYAPLSALVGGESTRVRAQRSEGRRLLDEALRDCRAQYGGVIRAMREQLRSDALVLDLLQGSKVPQKYAEAMAALPASEWALRAMMGLQAPSFGPSTNVGGVASCSDD